MDKLNDINRLGGYPLVAEGVQILQDHERAITAILDSFNLPFRTCVILQYSNNPLTGVLNEAFVYLVNYISLYSSPAGVIVKLQGDGNTKLQQLYSAQVQKSIVISNSLHSVSDGINTYPDAYIIQTAALVDPSAQNLEYKFMKITDLFGKNMISEATINKNQNANINLIISTLSNSIILVDKTKIIFDLHLEREQFLNPNSYCYYRIDFSPKLPIPSGVYTLDCKLIEYVEPLVDWNLFENKRLNCSLYNGAIQFQIPSSLQLSLTNREIIHISGTILL